MRAVVDLDIGRKTFASGLLPELIDVLRRSHPGDLVAVVGDEESIGPELEMWCRFTGNQLLEATVEKGRGRWVFRCGAAPVPAEDNRNTGRKPDGAALHRGDRQADHLRLVSNSDVFTSTGRTKTGVIWDLSVKKIDDGRCELANTVRSSATPELLETLVLQNRP